MQPNLKAVQPGNLIHNRQPHSISTSRTSIRIASVKRSKHLALFTRSHADPTVTDGKPQCTFFDLYPNLHIRL